MRPDLRHSSAGLLHELLHQIELESGLGLPDAQARWSARSKPIIPRYRRTPTRNLAGPTVSLSKSGACCSSGLIEHVEYVRDQMTEPDYYLATEVVRRLVRSATLREPG